MGPLEQTTVQESNIAFDIWSTQVLWEIVSST